MNNMETIKKGSTGADVKLLQEKLNQKGFSLVADGSFGEKTHLAVVQFQKNANLGADGVVGPKTWAVLLAHNQEDEVQPPPESKPKSNVIFSSNITDCKKSVVHKRSIEIFGEAGHTSKNPLIEISSTIRTPLEQANAMYDNEKSGNHIIYAAPGREVIAVYNTHKNRPKAEVVPLMIQKIEELAKRGQLVSRHCVPEDMYSTWNIIDVRKVIPNPRDFCTALVTYKEVTKIITPFKPLSGATYTSSKIAIDVNEPAIHVEFELS
jgi:hypothetical protein